MKKNELSEKVQTVKDEIKEALQITHDALNKGQQKQLVKKEKIKKLFDRYNVEYESEEK